MKSWTPLWSTIVTSTLWGESKEVKILFVTMIALKDKNGLVMARADGLSRLANLTYDETIEALKVLESKDKRSQEDQEFEGRRIQKVQDGWLVLNHDTYRKMIQAERRREYNARKQHEYRLKKKNTLPLINDPATNGQTGAASKERLAEGDIYS